ncbi:MAG: hypothetical protein JNM30_00795 [Rhodospirillales bacterium]|nr:hypothetical protein [Rhodospirillales bacterium]
MPSDLVNPKELRKIAAEQAMKSVDEALAQKKHAEEEARQVHLAFLERDIHPDVKNRVSTAVRRAAERGEHQVLALQFPSDWCTDRGRAINNFEESWPSTLTGFAKRAYEYFEKELRPLGYGVRAEVLNFPGGMPGDIGMYLTW